MSMDQLTVKWNFFSLIVLFSQFLISSSAFSQPVSFTDVTNSSGLNIQHGILSAPMSSVMTGGVAVGDIDNDGDDDLYFITGDTAANALMRNNGDGSFTNITSAAGVALLGEINSGPVFGDLNGDGWTDLLVGGYAGIGFHIFRNNADGSFSEFAETGIPDHPGRNDFSTSLGDPDRDGDLDLFISHWGPDTGNNHLWINDGHGKFTPADQAWGIDAYLSTDFTFTANFSDINGDGWQDLLVTGDFDTSQVFLNTGSGGFKNLTTDVINDENGMGAAVADFDNDGDMDWFISSIFQYEPTINGPPKASGNRLFINDGNGSFTNATTQAGLREGYWGWGACAADFDNDGWLDLVHTNGFPGSNTANDFWNDPMRLFLNDQHGSFLEISAVAGVTDTQQGRGVSCLDYDDDGDIDLLIMNHNGTSKLYRNNYQEGHTYLQVLPAEGQAMGTLAGTRISIEANGLKQMRELSLGGNFESQNSLTQHFGTGNAEVIDKLSIRWPNGHITTTFNVDTNQKIIINRPSLINAAYPVPIGMGTYLLIAVLLLCAGVIKIYGAATIERVSRNKF